MSLSSGVFTRTRSKLTSQILDSKSKAPPSVSNEKLVTPVSEKTSFKRKRTVTSSKPKKKSVSEDLTQIQNEPVLPQKMEKKAKIMSKNEDVEKRSRLFRKKAPLSYLERLSRATSQR